MNTNRPWVLRWDIPLLLAMFYAAFAGRFLQLWWSPWKPRGWRLWGWVIVNSLGWLTGD